VSISVALCTHNGGRFVEQQVASILDQNPAPFELVVGDDASTDDTIAIIERLVAGKQRDDPDRAPRLTVLRHDPALGVVENFAATIAACAGDLIALSDQDDVWRAGKLAALAGAFGDDPALLLAHTDARLVDGEGRSLGLTLLDALEVTPAERQGLEAGEALAVLLRRNLVTGATVMLRRDVRDAALPFPHDWLHDEWLAVIAASVGRLRLLPEPLIDYRQHGGNQIGARRPTLVDKVARLREPRAERAARLARRTAALAERGRLLGVAAEVQTQLDAKADHEQRRARLPRVRLARVPAVVGGAMVGRYSRYSRGAMDALRDLTAPAGDLPVMTVAEQGRPAPAPTDRSAE